MAGTWLRDGKPLRELSDLSSRVHGVCPAEGRWRHPVVGTLRPELAKKAAAARARGPSCTKLVNAPSLQPPPRPRDKFLLSQSGQGQEMGARVRWRHQMCGQRKARGHVGPIPSSTEKSFQL